MSAGAAKSEAGLAPTPVTWAQRSELGLLSLLLPTPLSRNVGELTLEPKKARIGVLCLAGEDRRTNASVCVPLTRDDIRRVRVTRFRLGWRVLEVVYRCSASPSDKRTDAVYVRVAGGDEAQLQAVHAALQAWLASGSSARATQAPPPAAATARA